MAGEWISMDCCLAQKPEVLEIIGETGEEVGTVLGRLFLFWSWASLNSSDGTVRGSAAILRAVAGGDEAFWKAVERVGWIELGDGTITVGGWENRFSKSAKSRLLANKRQKSKRHASVTHHRFTLSRISVTRQTYRQTN